MSYSTAACCSPLRAIHTPCAVSRLAQLQRSEERDTQNTARSAAGFETEQEDLLKSGELQAEQLQSAVLNATNKDSDLQLSSASKRQQVTEHLRLCCHLVASVCLCSFGWLLPVFAGSAAALVM